MSTSECNPVAVSPLPAGSGGGNTTKEKMNDTNVQLSLLQADSCASAKFDSPVPRPIKQAQVIQNFCSKSESVIDNCIVIGFLCIVYGLITK
jgi:hypothetical protein